MAALTIKFNYVRDYAVLYREDLKQRFDDSDYYHVTCSLTDKITPKGSHAEITDVFMDSHLL